MSTQTLILAAGTPQTVAPRLIDLLIVFACFAISVAIGYHFSRRQTGTSTYFLGGEKMPGWLVGFSITASTISAMTFVATPGFSFKEDYRWVLPCLSFLVMAIFAMAVLVPFFRRITTPSGYAFLEVRFGTWARVYAAASFLLFKLLRLGVILYVTSLTLEVFVGVPAAWLIVIVGLIATCYTMMGGFEAVVWTEFFQAVVLIIGALLIVPIALRLIPGGIGTVIDTAIPAGKMSLGSTKFSMAEKTVWVMVLSSLFYNASDYSTRQDFIQRYRAPRDAFQARLALLIAGVTVVPIWLYFNFLGTVLWVFYQQNPDSSVAAFASREPEKIVPYFMASHLPGGLNGLVLAAISMASLSAIAGVLNASAVTWVSDFHLRFIQPGKDERHAVKLGRITTGVTGLVMIFLALWIHAVRTQTLQDLQATGQMIFSAGLFGLFMIGFFGNRIGRRAAMWASITTIVLVISWLAIKSGPLRPVCPRIAAWLPDPFWIPVISNLALPAFALGFARFLTETTPAADQPVLLSEHPPTLPDETH